MKKIIIIVFVVSALFSNFAYSIDPSYEINVINITNISSNTLQFDIYLKHMNPAQVEFLYSMCQIMFDINPGFANGGALSFYYTPMEPKSDLSFQIRPTYPSVINNQLRLAAQPNSEYVNGYNISSSGNGTLIARMRLSTNALSFAGSLNLTLRNANSGGFYTKIYAFDQIGFGNYLIKNITNTESNKKYLDLRFRLEAMYPVLDSIKIVFRNSFIPYTAVDSLTVFSSLNATHFRVVAGFTNIQIGTSYFIEIVHRTSIATWSASPVLISTDTTLYNFTTSISQAYGNNMVSLNDIASIYSGDVTRNGFVDLTDVIMVNNDARYFITGYVNTDLTGNGIVDLTDLISAYNNSNKFVSVKRP